MKVALVYDHVNRIGGAERILQSLHELYPDAPLYSCVYDQGGAPWAAEYTVHTSFLQKIPLAKKYHEFFPGLSLLAMESFDFSDFDVVISVTSCEGKAIITAPQTLHICYCLTPTRYLWSHYRDYFNQYILKWLSMPMISMLRIWDMYASWRPDKFVAISDTVAQRINKYYQKSATIIFPPVDTGKFIPGNKRQDYYLIVSRLVKYKHIELAINACNKLKRSLKIVGDGPQKKYLQKLSGATIEFAGNLTDENLVKCFQECRALIFPQNEDFGISQVEALACGCPVIAFKRGAALEVQVEGITGEFFINQTTDSLIEALLKFEGKSYDENRLRQRSEKFAKIKFLQDFENLVKEEWSRRNRGQHL